MDWTAHLKSAFQQYPETDNFPHGQKTVTETQTKRSSLIKEAILRYLIIPYLFPTEISISLWAKVDHVFADNYMLSQNWWEGYKLQYQSANKVFFTYKNADATYFDRDWSVNGQDTTEWHHVVVTLKEGEENFYADGELVKSWTDVTGGLNPPANPVAFTIGQQFPNERPGIAPADDPAQWAVGYFKGSLDDIAIYNVALSASQVQSIL